jgi:signal transduction histidine kinase
METRSPLDFEALYELALAAGESLDPAAICRKVVGILVGRGAGARAAVWSNRTALTPAPSLLAAQTAYYTLACAPERPPATLAAAPGLEARLAQGEGFHAPAGHPDLAGLTAAGEGGDEVVVLPLGGEGFLELAPAAGLPAAAVLAALAPVARRLAVGLEGCRHRLAPEAGAERLQRLLHDVRTPLTAVRGFAELLAGRDFPAERRRELLGMLHAEALRLTEALDRASQAAPGEEGYQAAERLRLASRLEAVGQLAGGIAHDFNNLLTAISGYSELLLGRLGPGEPMRAELVEIHRAGERAADLTRQLLAFSRIQVLEPRRLDLNVEVREAASMLRRLIGEAIELVLDLDPALGTVEADPGQLHQVILNLAVNARDAMPGGGTLTLATDEVAFDRPDRSHPEVAMPAGRWVRLLVTDTGTGMDEQTRARIF